MIDVLNSCYGQYVDEGVDRISDSTYIYSLTQRRVRNKQTKKSKRKEKVRTKNSTYVVSADNARLNTVMNLLMSAKTFFI